MRQNAEKVAGLRRRPRSKVLNNCNVLITIRFLIPFVGSRTPVFRDVASFCVVRSYPR